MSDGVFKNCTQYGYLSADPTDPNYQYNQDIFSITWQGTGTDGIQKQSGIDSFKVTGQTPAAMAVDIEQGFIWIQGFVGWLQAADSLIVSPADPTYPRIDRVIARLSRESNKTISYGIIEGTPAATPTAPTLTQTDIDIYEVALYQIYISAGAITITDADLTDERIYRTVQIPAPIDGTDAANKDYVDSRLVTTTEINLSYSDLSGQSDINIYQIPSMRAVLSAAFKITDSFDIPIAPAISVNSQILTENPHRHQSAVGVFDTTSRTYFNATGTTADVNLFDFDSYWLSNAAWNLNTARYALAGCGVSDAALSFGGNTGASSAVTEKFNGSTWSTSGNLNTARYQLAGCGVSDAALSFGGNGPSAVTEKFNGSTWSTNGAWNLNTARYSLAGAGTQDAALSFGGYTSANSAVTEKFNGSTWSTYSSWNLNTARQRLAGCGTQDAALSFGGDTNTLSAVTEKFNGSSWTVSANLNTARRELAGAGTQDMALSFGGTSPGDVTEKYFNENYFPTLTSGELTIYLQVV